MSDPASSLRITLKKFAKPRHHSHPRGKHKARRLIKKMFLESGLHVWTEHVRLTETLHGENIVAMVKGKNTGTADDRIVIVGAHYDTTNTTKGVDDNGSGVTALLEIAKQIGRARCQTQHTILFVAFDFEEDIIVENHHLVPFGSKWFVRNLTSYLETTGGTVQGAFILEMLANHNNSKGSQMFPHKFSLVSPEAYEEVKRDGNRGNFLALIGRRDSEEHLISLLKVFYQQDSNYRAQMVPIPLSGRPSKSQYKRHLRDFYRSDHYSFWENTVSFKAVMLTDTSNFRKNMDKCYHRKCDNMKQIRKNDVEFLRRNVNAVLQTVLQLSEADSCHTQASGARRSISLHPTGHKFNFESSNTATMPASLNLTLVITVLAWASMAFN